MKKIVILVLFTKPAFAHQVPYSNPVFLKIAGGNPKAAQQIEAVCAGSRLTSQKCADKFSGAGNMENEAARNCLERMANTSFKFQVNGFDLDIPGSRMNQVEGKVWHKGYVKSSETGRRHRHKRSEIDEKRAVANYRAELITQAILEKTAFDGSVSKTSGGEVGGGLEFGVSTPVTLTISLNGNSGESKTNAIALLSDAKKKEIEEEAQKARGNYSLGGVEPSIVCYEDEEKCSDGSPNESYKKPETKKDDKKGAENSPKYEDDHTSDIPDIISTGGDELWAGNDTVTPDTALATPVLDENLAPKSALERCVEKESKRLNDEFGKTTIDESKLGEEDERKQRAESLLKTGYCQESYFGKEFCAKHAFQQDSVVAIGIKDEREAAAKAALERFQKTGICSPTLGSDFCKKARESWQKTPAGEDSSKSITPSSGSSIKLPDGRVFNLPDSPVKSGDLPRKIP